jgi:hypothetical protein
MEQMGIPVNLEESTLVRATIDRVRQETVKKASIDNIVKFMRSRFRNDVPTDLKERLERHTQEELDEIVERSATAASVEAALDISSSRPSPTPGSGSTRG